MAQATTIEMEHAARLSRQRAGAKRGLASRATKGAAAKAAAKLNKLIAEGHDWLAFGIVISLALFKDGVIDFALDFIGIGEIPIIGQLPGYFVTAILAYYMLGKGMLRRRLRRGVVLFIADNLMFGINNLPLTTINVLLSWRAVVKRARKAAQDLKELSRKTEEELARINSEEYEDI